MLEHKTSRGRAAEEVTARRCCNVIVSKIELSVSWLVPLEPDNQNTRGV
jgi:hypothetical protein